VTCKNKFSLAGAGTLCKDFMPVLQAGCDVNGLRVIEGLARA